MLIGLFLAQSAVRLALLGPVFNVGWGSAPVHLWSLLVVMPAFCAALVKSRNRLALQILALLPIAAIWMMLTIYDVDAVQSALIQSRPMAFDDLANFYCQGWGWTSCLSRYPQVTLAIVLVYGMIVFGLLLCADPLQAALRKIGQRARGLVGAKGLWASLLVPLAYAATCTFAPSLFTGREPLFYLLSKREFVDGPSELRYMRRPEYRVEPTPGAHDRLVVLISVDSLRADAVGLKPGPTLTPFLRSLAQTGNLHDLGPAIATCTFSYCGLVSLHSSQSWATLQRGPPLTLADVFSANGYKSYFLLSSSHRLNAHLAYLYGNVSLLLDDMSRDSVGFFDDRNQILRLERLRLDRPGRSFIAIHLMSAHSIGKRFEVLTKPSTDQIAALSRTNSTARFYAGGVKQADAVIERLFGVLRKRGLLGDALIVITADHGERMQSVDGGTHGGRPDISTVQIPLLIYDSSRPKFPEHGLVSQMDVAPTILGSLGIAIPQSWQGHSLLHNGRRTVTPSDSASFTAMVALIDGEKLLFLCDLSNGQLKITDLTEAPVSRELRRSAALYATRLYGSMPRRNDAYKCFSSA